MNLDYRLRTDNRAIDTSAAIVALCLRGEIAVLVGFFSYLDAVLNTCCYTQPASLASFGINYNLGCHLAIRVSNNLKLR